MPLHGRWLPAEQLRQYMHMKCNIGNDITFSLSTMMRVINKALPLVSAEPNVMEISDNLPMIQVYRYTFQHRTRRYFFWVTAKVGVLPALPSQRNASVWEQDSVLTRLLTRNCFLPDEREAKRHKGLDDGTDGILDMDRSSESVPIGEAVIVTATPDAEETTVITSSGSWWESGDARKLFAPCKERYGTNCDVKAIVIERIEILESVNATAANWKKVVDTIHTSAATESQYSESDVFSLRYRSMYLALVLRQFVLHVTDNLKTQWTWKRCLRFAIETLNDIGVEFYSSFETLARWHRKFAQHRYFFYKAPDASQPACPPFFADNPDAMDAFKKYGVENIKDLCVEMMLEYVHQDLVPKLMLKRRDHGGLYDDNGDDAAVGVATTGEEQLVNPSTQAAFLRSYGLSTISIATMARWMHACGFRFKRREKHYFVDGHERPETIAYRPVFTKKYLGYEIRAHRWLQVTLQESNSLVSEGNIAPGCGFNYKAADGIDMVEYHIDASYTFDERLDLLPFGGSLSVRKPIDSRPVIFVGQDEAIFKQFLFLSKMWVGPNGERPLLPKDEGAGTMISTFTCREHGLIRELTAAILIEVNLQRAGRQYSDEEAAIEINGNSNKKPLTLDKSPFVVFFDYGENKEGYWAYNNMVLQFEDVVDVLKVMHPTFDFVFLFDHSSGHSKQRPDGLNQHRMNRSFGGKAVPRMRSTEIIQEEGFLGPFDRTVEPGDTQSLVFSPSDTGPFWMTDAEREESRLDKHLGNTRPVNLTVPELILQLRENANVEYSLAGKSIRQLRSLCTKYGLETHKSVDIVHERNRTELELDLRGLGVSTKGKNKRELVELCAQHQIAVSKNVEKIKEGWVGKPKGLLQVLWERGLIDTGVNLKDYSLTGKKDALGTIDNSTNLRHIMGMCSDFLNEEGMMQHIAKNIGVTVLLTPKCHAELAGEGVEYLWACAKGAYRNMSLREKKGKDNFKASVCHCLSEEVITKVRIRKFARRARQYLMAYHAIDTQQVDQQTLIDCATYGPVALTKLIIQFKTHRCAFDFDYKFVMSCMQHPLPPLCEGVLPSLVFAAPPCL